jgi:hypothetical protein
MVVSDPALPPEDPLVLDEIDRIISDLQTRRENGSTPRSPPPWTVPLVGRGAGFPNQGGEGNAGVPSGYFEEHLEAARRAVGNIDEQVGDLENTSAALRQRVAAAESELDRITREYYFVRSNGGVEGLSAGDGGSSAPWSEDAPSPPVPSGPSDNSHLASGSFTAIQAASADGEAPVYERFTVDRYNRTVDSMKAGRTKLVAWTLLLSAIIGVALLALVLYSPVVNPPMWVAVLPLVWIVPIPYFLLSFRGTQRILTRTHLTLPDAK